MQKPYQTPSYQTPLLSLTTAGDKGTMQMQHGWWFSTETGTISANKSTLNEYIVCAVCYLVMLRHLTVSPVLSYNQSCRRRQGDCHESVSHSCLISWTMSLSLARTPSEVCCSLPGIWLQNANVNNRKNKRYHRWFCYIEWLINISLYCIMWCTM